MNQNTALLRTASSPQPQPSAPQTTVAQLCAMLDTAFHSLTDTADPSGHTAFAYQVRAALAAAAAAPDLLTAAQRESGLDNYRRHLLASDPHGRYTIVSLVWRPGQQTPIHGHHAWCGYAIVSGTLHEELYRWDNVQHRARAMHRQTRAIGATSYVQPGLNAGIHRLTHAGADNAPPAISLHVYGVAHEQVSTQVNHVVHATTSEYA